MKIVFINSYYDYGSTGKLTANFANYCKNNKEEITVLCGKSEIRDEMVKQIETKIGRYIHSRLGYVTGLNGLFSNIATIRAKRHIAKIDPDVVYLGNLHGCYINQYTLLNFLRRKKIHTVQILWDEYEMTGACAFAYDCKKYMDICEDCPRKKEYPGSFFFDTSKLLQRLKKKAYDMDNIVFVGVPFTVAEARKSTILKGHSFVELDEGVDQTIFYPRTDCEDIIRKYGIDTKKIILLNVCVFSSKRKGGDYYLELAKRFEKNEKYQFIHIGYDGDRSKCPPNFLPIGYEDDQNIMAQFYSLADLFICTSFAETQPNTCLEALSCGCRILGFDISGIPTCGDEPYGIYVEPANINQMEQVIEKTKKRTKEETSFVAAYAYNRFSSKKYNQRLFELRGYNNV